MEVVQPNATKLGNPVNIEGSSELAKPEPKQQRSSYGGSSNGSSGGSNYQNPYASRAAQPVSRADPNVQVFPISALNPYQSRWTIKARFVMS
jgi:hypothetical protein